MKVQLYEDEWYPVYGIAKGFRGDREVEIDEKTFKRWKKAEDHWSMIQHEMREAYKSA